MNCDVVFLDVIHVFDCECGGVTNDCVDEASSDPACAPAPHVISASSARASDMPPDQTILASSESQSNALHVRDYLI